MWPFKKSKPEPATSAPQLTRELRPLSFVPPEFIRQIGSPPTEACFGFKEGEGDGVEQFRPNPPFVGVLHEVIRRHVPVNPALQAAARRQQSGSLLIIDARAREGPDGSISKQDISGILEVEDGVISSAQYLANDRYVVFTEDGADLAASGFATSVPV